MTDTETLLAERAKTHGEYAEHARITQGIMDLVQGGRNWPRLTPVQRESLHMFAHKIGRICEGDPNHADHWDDISGYAVLASQRLPTRHRVGDPPLTGNPEAHDYEGTLASAGWRLAQRAMEEALAEQAPPPVPVEDSNRHADRAPRPLSTAPKRPHLTRYEYHQLPVGEEREAYEWDETRGEWRLKP